jgi:uncharacterized membrane protein
MTELHVVEPRAAAGARATARLASIDVVRGVVMALMALDHVRVYSGIPAGGPTAAVFLTRWVTHFCAPAFFFLAGTSAFLRGNGRSGEPSLSRWLVTRGLVLVALELTVIRLSWTFNFDYAHYVLAGVIWSLGWCMVLLAGIVRLPMQAIVAFAFVVIAGHNAIPLLLGGRVESLLGSPAGPLARVLYFGGAFAIGGATEPNAFVLYSLIPWIGVMSAGYAFGTVMTRTPPARRDACLRLGLVCTLAFLALRGFQLYGDRPWMSPPGQPWAPAWIRFLATSKYPASLQFLLMTLGPILIALGALEGRVGRIAGAFVPLGRVPMFYYLLHIPLIHLVALVIATARTPAALPWLFSNHPMNPPEVPAGYGWPLPLLYVVTVLVVAALVVPCRWYARRKAERRWAWMSYV